MKNNVFVFLTGLIVLFAVQTLRAQPSVQQQKDSLRRVITLVEGEEKLEAYKRLASFYAREVRNAGVIDTLSVIYDEWDAEAARQGNMKEQAMVRTNKLVAFANKQLFDEVIRQAPACLGFMEEKEMWKYYYQTYDLFIASYRSTGDYDSALREAQSMYNRAKERQDEAGRGVALYAMSRIYNGQRRFADQEQCLRESIPLLENDESYINYLSTARTFFAQNLIAQKRYSEALQVLFDTEEVNRRYEMLAKSPMPNSWINLWISYGDAYLQTGEYDKAEYYMNKVDSISNSSYQQFEGRAQVLAARRQYEKALEEIDKGIEFARNKRQPKGIKLFILTDMGEAQKAKDLFGEIVTELDSLHNLDFTTRLDEMRTQYEVEKHIAEKERNRHYFFFALGGCLLLLILLAGAFRYNRIVTMKNLRLYRQIKEQDRLAGELDEINRRYETLTHPAAQTGEEAVVESLLPRDKRQRDLVARLKEFILCDGNLANTDINRDDLTAALATNRNTLSDAVRAVTGKTLMEYIRTLQLEETRSLFDNHPELTVEAIATDCGFTSLSTFYRLFRKKYGISPAEYRKMANSTKG